MQPAVSIITVSYRSWDRLAKCLDSVKGQLDGNLEMIVVDNHSNDGKADAFLREYPWVTFIPQDINGGFAQANNKGAGIAKSKWLLFLNPDAVLEPGVLDKLIAKAEEEPGWKLISIKQYNEAGSEQHPYGNFPRWWTIWPLMRSVERMFRGKENTKHYMNSVPVSRPDWLSGSFILIRKEDFFELGRWDQRFWMYSEDADLSRRAADKGWDRVMYNELKCMHAHGGSSRINADTKAITKSEVIRSEYRYIDKHFKGPGRWIGKATLIVITAIELILTAPFSPVKRKMLLNLAGGKGMPRVGYEIH